MRASAIKRSRQDCEKEVSSRPLKAFHHSTDQQVSVIRKELVALTRNSQVAVVLNQLLYWAQRIKDFDLFLEEERNFNPEDKTIPCYGWIYKTADELIEETLLTVSRPTMRKYLRALVEGGWIEEKTNPDKRWDRTSHYHINLRKIHDKLLTLGYRLSGFDMRPFDQDSKTEEKGSKTCHTLDVPPSDPSKDSYLTSELKNLPDEERNLPSKLEILPDEERNLSSKLKNLPGQERNLPSKLKNLRAYTYTETTTENTNREHAEKTRAREEFSIAEEMVALWEQHICKNALQLTEERKGQLESLFAFHFQNDIRLWERFCLRVKTSPFLMGEGARRWRATLDWILVEANLLKVLEGNFDDPDAIETRRQDAQANPENDREKEAILASIKDPVWKKWCSRLAEGLWLNESQMLEKPLSLFDLKQIAHAWVIECEDERLVWIGSQDPNVLRKIDDLRLKMTWVFATDYPKARTLRTRLETSIPQTLSSGDRPEDPLKGNIHHAE
ncbi:MAG TPA: hypothetical protein VMW10_07535 [Alphaproteobacteria bacterium]|nr:hypothetical protein [Alphaproteobacteria bacterium]